MVERALSGDSNPMKILVIHGAGMNMRGKAQVEIFGPMTLPEYDAADSRLCPGARHRGRDLPFQHRRRGHQPPVRGARRGHCRGHHQSRRFHPRLSGPYRRHRQRRLSDDRGPHLQSGAARRRFRGGDELPRHRVRLRHRRLRARPARTEGPREGLTPPASESQAFDTVRQIEALLQGKVPPGAPSTSIAGRGGADRQAPAISSV